MRAEQGAEARAKDLSPERDPAAAWARPGGPEKAAREEPDPAVAWEVRVRLKEQEIRVVARIWVAQAHRGGAEGVPWVEVPVQVAVEALVQVERAVVRVQVEEDDKMLSTTPAVT